MQPAADSRAPYCPYIRTFGCYPSEEDLPIETPATWSTFGPRKNKFGPSKTAGDSIFGEDSSRSSTCSTQPTYSYIAATPTGCKGPEAPKHPRIAHNSSVGYLRNPPLSQSITQCYLVPARSCCKRSPVLGCLPLTVITQQPRLR